MDFLPRVIRIVLKGLPHTVQRNATKAEYNLRGKIQGTVTLTQVQYSVFPTGDPGVLQAIRERGVFAYLGNNPEQPPVADGLIAQGYIDDECLPVVGELAILEFASIPGSLEFSAARSGKKLNLYPFGNVYNGLAAVSVVGKKSLLDGEIVSEVNIPHLLFGPDDDGSFYGKSVIGGAIP